MCHKSKTKNGIRLRIASIILQYYSLLPPTKQTNVSRTYICLTQYQQYILYVSMHEYTYVGTVCDTDANATLMEMRAGGLCVMIE